MLVMSICPCSHNGKFTASLQPEILRRKVWLPAFFSIVKCKSNHYSHVNCCPGYFWILLSLKFGCVVKIYNPEN